MDKSLLEVAAEARMHDYDRLLAAMSATAATGSLPPRAPPAATPTSGDAQHRRTTTFDVARGSGADTEVTTVSAELPRTLTEPDLNTLPTFDATSGTASSFRREFEQLVGYVPAVSKGIYLRAKLRGALRDKVEADLEHSGVGPSTAVDLATLWDLIFHHSSSSSDPADYIAKAVGLVQSSASQFASHHSKFTQSWLDAGISFGRDSLDPADWTAVRIGLLSQGLHSSVMRELLRDPTVFQGSYDEFRRACEAISSSLGHQAGRRAGMP